MPVPNEHVCVPNETNGLGGGMLFHCGFCGKDNKKVMVMIRGQYACICNECIVECVEELARMADVNKVTAKPGEVGRTDNAE